MIEKRSYVRKDEIRNTIGMSYDFVHKLSDDCKIQLISKERGSLKGYLPQHIIDPSLWAVAN